mmetsp:Transcript_77962/g.252095  ORF Transcript_77962/g.252095 Transcript_77962/m.252095 type:complete len:91 (-) Transcript_77962:232-504(-)
MLSQRLWGQCLGMMHFRRIAKAMSVSWRMSDLLIPDALASGTSEQTPHAVVPFFSHSVCSARKLKLHRLHPAVLSGRCRSLCCCPARCKV